MEETVRKELTQRMHQRMKKAVSTTTRFSYQPGHPRSVYNQQTPSTEGHKVDSLPHFLPPQRARWWTVSVSPPQLHCCQTSSYGRCFNVHSYVTVKLYLWAVRCVCHKVFHMPGDIIFLDH